MHHYVIREVSLLLVSEAGYTTARLRESAGGPCLVAQN